MRVLLCGEGDHEMGDPMVWDARHRVHVQTEGWMQTVVRRLRPDVTVFETRRRRDLFLDRRLTRAWGVRPQGHGAKAQLARFIADNEGFDAVIYMADADSNVAQDWASIVADIKAGFAALPAAITVPSAPCVPMSASESWWLADASAWTGLGLPNPQALPSRPESIWGARDDPADNHPHQLFARVCEAAGVPDDRATRVQIAQASDLNNLIQRCPTSFAEFANDIAFI